MKKYFFVLLTACGAPQTTASDAGASAASDAIADAHHKLCTPPTSVISLPADDAVHNAATEWWYYTGHLDGAYGFELVFFQLQNPDGSFSTVSHFAITDDRDQVFYSQTSTGNGAYSQVQNGFDLSVPAGWRAHGGNGSDSLFADAGDFGVDLQVRDEKGVMINDGDGHVVFPDGTANYYYSRPKMSAQGRIKVNGCWHDVVGTAWFDHQWGALPFTTWTWYGIQLDDNTQLLTYQIRLPDNTTVIAQGGTYFAADCTQTPLAPTDLAMSWTGSWTSAASDYTYPTTYALSVPSMNASLAVIPTLQDQELMNATPVKAYVEAESTVSGTNNGSAVSGMAYVENVPLVQLP